tara:strand:- start:47 stop:256 length:210 start_codon:yes stop_codon:yes gene_type:complete
MVKQILISPEGIEEVELTAEEETQRQADILEQQEFDNSMKQKNTLKASAKAKLIAGEALTEDEANTIVL